MSVKLFTEDEKTEFVAIARAGIEADKTPALIRAELSERFGFDNLKVCNALTRNNIALFETRTGLLHIRDVDRSVTEAVVERAKELIAQGTGLLRVRAMLSIEFNIYETSVSFICLKAGVDVRTDAYRGDIKPAEKKEVHSDLGYADYDPAEDKILQAAKELRDKKVDVGKANGQWFLEGRPVNCVQVMIRAGMGC